MIFEGLTIKKGRFHISNKETLYTNIKRQTTKKETIKEGRQQRYKAKGRRRAEG
tara:strand:- start:149 stop:310 length:162 start_codon:yes stop_codon:yes gene_type:complete